MTNVRRDLAGALLVLVALTGCAAQEGDNVQSGSGGAMGPVPATSGAGPSTPVPATSAPEQIQEPLPGPPGLSKSKGSTKRLTGTVVDGVEHGCLLLQTDEGAYLLVGGNPDQLRVGARVTVQGSTDPGLLTTCQQGVPFRVSSVS